MDTFFLTAVQSVLNIVARYCRGNQVVRLFSLDVSYSKTYKQQPGEDEPYWSVEPNTTFYLQYRIEITIKLINTTHIRIIFLNKIWLCYINSGLFSSNVVLAVMTRLMSQVIISNCHHLVIYQANKINIICATDWNKSTFILGHLSIWWTWQTWCSVTSDGACDRWCHVFQLFKQGQWGEKVTKVNIKCSCISEYLKELFYNLGTQWLIFFIIWFTMIRNKPEWIAKIRANNPVFVAKPDQFSSDKHFLHECC